MTYEKKYPDGDTPRTCVRDGFDRAGGVLCKRCFEKDRQIEQLRDKVAQLQAQVRRLRKSANEPFGKNTPSSKKLLKTNAAMENQKKMGGAKKGHKGHGRKRHEPSTVPHMIQ